MDAVEFMRRMRRVERENADSGAERSVRVAVLGTDSIQYVVRGVRCLLYERYGVRGIMYEGDYDGIAREVMDGGSAYHAFGPEVTVVLPGSREADAGLFRGYWGRMPGHVLQANFVQPNVTVLGNLEANVGFSETVRVLRANLDLAEGRPSNVTILDLNGLATRVGTDRWFDYPAYFSTKQGFCLDFLYDVCDLIARQVGALLGMTRKCLVLDLDNTLWGGVVAEEGWGGIRIDPNDPVGEAYRAFQKYILGLRGRGVILAVSSKNDLEVAREPFEKNRNMVLKLSDIACFAANWLDKAANLRGIAKALNIGTDSLVFFDDNPAEREEVRACLPEVLVIDAPDDPAHYARALSESGAFDWLQVTREDMARADSYRSNALRESLLEQSEDYDAYLDALEMRYDIGLLDRGRVPRFAQLINKSNQFNVRTRRYSEGEIEAMLSDPSCKLIYAELSDRFDEYGLISCVIIRDGFIDTWVMSCRVLKRRVEEKVFEFILQNTSGTLRAEYIPTAKNGMVEGLYPQLGFKEAGRKGEYVYERF